MNKYKKISKDDVFNILVSIATDPMNPIGIINLVNLADLLQTSRYQAKKYINELVKDELAELSYEDMNTEDELYPPYWGYGVTKKVRETEYFKEQEKKAIELLEKCFSVNYEDE